MASTCFEEEQPYHPQNREMPRNCGPLLGKLDELLPCLYLAQFGASYQDLRERLTATAPGVFTVGEFFDGEHPGVGPRVGLILPVRLCRDEKTRMALEEIPGLLDNQGQTRVSDRRRAVQTQLDVAFGGDLWLDDKETLDGFFALKPSPGLFQRLQASFDYVTAVLDNPAGTVRVTGTSPFTWRSYGDLMEWYHTLRGAERSGDWSPLTPFFVCANTDALYDYFTERLARTGLRTPTEDPSKWFVLRPGLPDARIGIRLEMREYGWARLCLSLDAADATISLSDVYDPFVELVAWGREIDEGDLPIQMEIDEEGKTAVLTVLCTNDPGRVLLRVTRDDSDEFMLEGIVARTALAAALKAELIRFFTTEFDPQHWDVGRGRDAEEGYIQTRDRVLNHPWLASSPK